MSQALNNSRTAYRQALRDNSGIPFARVMRGQGADIVVENLGKGVEKILGKGKLNTNTAMDVARALAEGATKKNIINVMRSRGVTPPEAILFTNRLFQSVAMGAVAAETSKEETRR